MFKKKVREGDGGMRSDFSLLMDGINDHIYANEDTTDIADSASLLQDIKWKIPFELDNFQNRADDQIE